MLTQRIIDEAITLTVTRGWPRLTMGQLAQAVGVSRQTIYNEVGTKSRLAELVVASEALKFLAVVEQAFDENAPDVSAAVQAAVTRVLTMGRENPLLHAVVATAHGVHSELLPLITTQSSALLATAAAVVTRRLHECGVPFERAELISESVVRLVLSHLMQPTKDIQSTAHDICALVEPSIAVRC